MEDVDEARPILGARDGAAGAGHRLLAGNGLLQRPGDGLQQRLHLALLL